METDYADKTVNLALEKLNSHTNISSNFYKWWQMRGRFVQLTENIKRLTKHIDQKKDTHTSLDNTSLGG